MTRPWPPWWPLGVGAVCPLATTLDVRLAGLATSPALASVCAPSGHRLTPDVGMRMCALPLDPPLGRALLASFSE